MKAMKQLRSRVLGTVLSVSAGLSPILSVGVFAGVVLAGAQTAEASVSLAARFDQLVERSHAAVMATPMEQKSIWEEGKIFTYTRVKIDDAAAGELPTGSEAWVVTRGGMVGDIGQQVDGEAVFRVGVPTLVFLARDLTAKGVFVVTSRAQGQWQVMLNDQKAKVLRASVGGGMNLQAETVLHKELTPRELARPVAMRRLATEVLKDRPLAEAMRDIANAWSVCHAAQK